MSVARITEYVRRRESVWPRPSDRLEVGTEVWAVLRATAPPPEPAAYGSSWGSPIGRILDLPVVENEDLEPLAWQLFDGKQVIDSGTMDV